MDANLGDGGPSKVLLRRAPANPLLIVHEERGLPIPGFPACRRLSSVAGPEISALGERLDGVVDHGVPVIGLDTGD